MSRKINSYAKHFLKILVLALCSGFSALVFCYTFSLSEAKERSPSHSETNIRSPFKNPPTVGILVPLEHAALKDIVAGFKTKVAERHPNAVFNVQNAQGDIKLARSIIEQFVGQKLDIIVPIGTTSTQMALSYVKKIPIISLAAEYSEEERQKRASENITGILDEIGGVKKIHFIKQVYPSLKTITVIFHSANEKNFKEVEDIVREGNSLNICVQKISVHALPELKTAVKSLDKNTEAILILKDHLMASGIHLLIPTAESRLIPLISSDEGSVQEGAAFALGMQEYAIGEAGGDLANKVLEGEALASLPMQEVKDLAVFYNRRALAKIRRLQDLEQLQAVAEKEGYRFMMK